MPLNPKYVELRNLALEVEEEARGQVEALTLSRTLTPYLDPDQVLSQLIDTTQQVAVLAGIVFDLAGHAAAQ